MINLSPDPLPTLRVPSWADVRGLEHGFLGRRGGVSQGAFAELNLSFSVGDDEISVRQNWARLSATSGLRFATMTQVHGSRLVTVGADDVAVGEADAMLTQVLGVGLGVLTADCVPILLVAPAQRVVAAVHAGWRGTVAGIVVSVVTALARLGAPPASLRAALGPAIGGCCYEVDDVVASAFCERRGMSDAVSRVAGRRAHVDLRHANVACLRLAGIAEESISRVGGCTRCEAADYFSYRGADGTTGRQLSYIGWTE